MRDSGLMQGHPPAALPLCPSSALTEGGRAWVWDVLQSGQVCWYPSFDARPLPPASMRDTAAAESSP